MLSFCSICNANQRFRLLTILTSIVFQLHSSTIIFFKFYYIRHSILLKWAKSANVRKFSRTGSAQTAICAWFEDVFGWSFPSNLWFAFCRISLAQIDTTHSRIAGLLWISRKIILQDFLPSGDSTTVEAHTHTRQLQLAQKSIPLVCTNCVWVFWDQILLIKQWTTAFCRQTFAEAIKYKL